MIAETAEALGDTDVVFSPRPERQAATMRGKRQEESRGSFLWRATPLSGTRQSSHGPGLKMEALSPGFLWPSR